MPNDLGMPLPDTIEAFQVQTEQPGCMNIWGGVGGKYSQDVQICGADP